MPKVIESLVITGLLAILFAVSEFEILALFSRVRFFALPGQMCLSATELAANYAIHSGK